MENQDQYYQLPDNSDQSLRRMGWALFIFFACLIVFVALVVINAQTIAKSIPFSAEKQFIRPYEQAIRKWYPGETNAEVDQYLQDLAENLAAGMDMPEGVELEVHFVRLGVVNAFATLGGHIFIFEGLLNKMPDENSLSMVLAHEIAHIKHRDPVAAMGRGFAIQMLYGFVTNDYSGSADLITASGEVGMSFFSREQEKQADLVALEALNTHYGHVSGYDDFFSIMQAEMESEDMEDMPEWLASHPDLDNRIEYLKQAIVAAEHQEGEVSGIPDNILKITGNDEAEY